MELGEAKRILILGCGGAGKSTLARRLGAATGLPVVHLDGLYWQPGWVAMERAAWRRTVENEIAKDAWIIDGNFGSSLELRLSRAQAAVYLDYSRAVCLAGVLRRVWTTHGRVRPDMGAGCPERFDLRFLRWVWDFPKRDGTHVKALLAAHPEVRCVTLKNRRDAQVLLRRLEGRMMEAYKTIQGTAQARIEEKKSEFIAHAAFADTEEKALAFLNGIRAKHRTANHNVYAYILRDGARMRYSDDGEPAKTSGLPTLEAIRHAGLVDCIVVTTRYFGGTLLGTGGLVRAYTAAANAVLAAAKQVTVQVCVRGVLRVEYPLYELAQRLLADAGARLEEVQFADRVTLPFVMLAGGETQLLPKLQELCRGSADIMFSKPYFAPF